MAGPESRIRSRYCTEARKRGHLVLVLHGSAYSGPGRADTLTLVCPTPVMACGVDLVPGRGILCAIEFKTPTGKARSTQLQFLRAVRDAGGYAFIAREASLALRAVDLISSGLCPYEEKGMTDDLELDSAFVESLEFLKKFKRDGAENGQPPAPEVKAPGGTLTSADTVWNRVAPPTPEEVSRDVAATAENIRQRRTRGPNKPKAPEQPVYVTPSTRIEVASSSTLAELLIQLIGALDVLTQAVNALSLDMQALREAGVK